MQENEILARVKRVGEYFTLDTQVEQRKRRDLCEQCGVAPVCDTRYRVKRITDEGDVILPIKTCRDFRPQLTFSDRRGLEFSTFNTFRMGRAWFDRLAEEDLVTLIDTRTNAAIVVAKVEKLYVGLLRDIGGQHAPRNHLLIGVQGVEDYAQAMFGILKKSYGQLYVDWDKNVSIIYLRPMTDAA